MKLQIEKSAKSLRLISYLLRSSLFSLSFSKKFRHSNFRLMAILGVMSVDILRRCV